MLKKNSFSFDRNIIFPLILIIFFLLFFFNDIGIVRWYQLRQEKEQIQIDINHLINKEKKLTQELYLLGNDAEYIKKIAKEKFHMVKPGEKVFRIVDRRKLKTEQINDK